MFRNRCEADQHLRLEWVGSIFIIRRDGSEGKGSSRDHVEWEEETITYYYIAFRHNPSRSSEISCRCITCQRCFLLLMLKAAEKHSRSDWANRISVLGRSWETQVVPPTWIRLRGRSPRRASPSICKFFSIIPRGCNYKRKREYLPRGMTTKLKRITVVDMLEYFLCLSCVVRVWRQEE